MTNFSRPNSEIDGQPLITIVRNEREIEFDWPSRHTPNETWSSENTDIGFGKVHEGGVEIMVEELRHYEHSDRWSTQYITQTIPANQIDELIMWLIQYRNESQGKRYIDAKKEGVSPEAKDQVEIAWKALSKIANAPKLTKVDEAFGKIALDAMNEMKAVNK